jgi:hypothetical protein
MNGMEFYDCYKLFCLTNKTEDVVCFHLGNSPASEFYMPTFQNTLSVPSSKAGRCRMTKFENCWDIHTGDGLVRK